MKAQPTQTAQTTQERNLAQAVGEWVEAEWFFRHGPCAYRTIAAERYLKAERRLRRCLTGSGELETAYKVVEQCREKNPSA